MAVQNVRFSVSDATSIDAERKLVAQWLCKLATDVEDGKILKFEIVWKNSVILGGLGVKLPDNYLTVDR